MPDKQGRRAEGKGRRAGAGSEQGSSVPSVQPPVVIEETVVERGLRIIKESGKTPAKELKEISDSAGEIWKGNANG